MKSQHARILYAQVQFFCLGAPNFFAMNSIQSAPCRGVAEAGSWPLFHFA